MVLPDAPYLWRLAGVRHAEFNREPETTTLFQIWIETDKPGAKPAWDQRPLPKDHRDGRFAVLASGMAGDEDALKINADARVLGATLKAGEEIRYPLGEGRLGYLVPSLGSVEVNGVAIGPRDGAAIKDESELVIRAVEDAELVMVDSR